ncbi:MAG: hypothetical protein CM15mP55_3090 [Hyphomicrobiales bacterium]|nr:MAG: hypothetical protein CM15mP55_3090 [Hyphomicrobiales bacterium]
MPQKANWGRCPRGLCRRLFADLGLSPRLILRLILSGVLHQLLPFGFYARPPRLARRKLPGPGQRVVNFCFTI